MHRKLGQVLQSNTKTILLISFVCKCNAPEKSRFLNELNPKKAVKVGNNVYVVFYECLESALSSFDKFLALDDLEGMRRTSCVPALFELGGGDECRREGSLNDRTALWNDTSEPKQQLGLSVVDGARSGEDAWIRALFNSDHTVPTSACLRRALEILLGNRALFCSGSSSVVKEERLEKSLAVLSFFLLVAPIFEPDKEIQNEGGMLSDEQYDELVRLLERIASMGWDASEGVAVRAQRLISTVSPEPIKENSDLYHHVCCCVSEAAQMRMSLPTPSIRHLFTIDRSNISYLRPEEEAEERNDPLLLWLVPSPDDTEAAVLKGEMQPHADGKLGAGFYFTESILPLLSKCMRLKLWNGYRGALLFLCQVQVGKNQHVEGQPSHNEVKCLGFRDQFGAVLFRGKSLNEEDDDHIQYVVTEKFRVKVRYAVLLEQVDYENDAEIEKANALRHRWHPPASPISSPTSSEDFWEENESNEKPTRS